MNWKQGIPKESGLYWLYWEYAYLSNDPPTPIIQPMLFYAATEDHEAVYTSNVWWYDSDKDGNIFIDERVYKDPDTHRVCINDEKNTYWSRIKQPDPPEK